MSSKTKRRTAAENRLEAYRHPLRSAILQILANRAATPSEMARELEEDLSLVSHHTKKLVELECAELVYERKTVSSVEHVYRATDRHLVEVGDWDAVLECGPELGEFLVGEFMQAIIDDFVIAANAEVGQDEDFHITRTPISVDAEGLREALDAFEQLRTEIEQIQQRALARGGADLRLSSSLALFRLSPPSR
jgi:hypothetical protein